MLRLKKGLKTWNFVNDKKILGSIEEIAGDKFKIYLHEVSSEQLTSFCGDVGVWLGDISEEEDYEHDERP
jgi:hypothetical protein